MKTFLLYDASPLLVNVWHCTTMLLQYCATQQLDHGVIWLHHFGMEWGYTTWLQYHTNEQFLYSMTLLYSTTLLWSLILLSIFVIVWYYSISLLWFDTTPLVGYVMTQHNNFALVWYYSITLLCMALHNNPATIWNYSRFLLWFNTTTLLCYDVTLHNNFALAWH